MMTIVTLIIGVSVIVYSFYIGAYTYDLFRAVVKDWNEKPDLAKVTLCAAIGMLFGTLLTFAVGSAVVYTSFVAFGWI